VTEMLRERLRDAVGTRDGPRPRKLLLVPGLARYATRSLARVSGTPHRLPARLFFGGEMEVVLPDCVSEAVYLFGFFDEVTSRLAMEAARPGDTVLDIGAHIGYFSLLFSTLVGETGRVFSFEPTPATFDVLSANARRRPNITVTQAAVGDEAGQHEMTAYDLRYVAFNTLSEANRLPAKADAHGTRITVTLLRLDDFLRERGIVPDVIKIDAENFENHVIGGLLETLAAHHPRVILETGEAATLEAAKDLLALGYQPFYCRSQSVEPWHGTIEEANAGRRDLLFMNGQ
jgi:FkbM family methyltransferase